MASGEVQYFICLEQALVAEAARGAFGRGSGLPQHLTPQDGIHTEDRGGGVPARAGHCTCRCVLEGSGGPTEVCMLYLSQWS